jgi:arginine deiminase
MWRAKRRISQHQSWLWEVESSVISSQMQNRAQTHVFAMIGNDVQTADDSMKLHDPETNDLLCKSFTFCSIQFLLVPNQVAQFKNQHDCNSNILNVGPHKITTNVNG